MYYDIFVYSLSFALSLTFFFVNDWRSNKTVAVICNHLRFTKKILFYFLLFFAVFFYKFVILFMNYGPSSNAFIRHAICWKVHMSMSLGWFDSISIWNLRAFIVIEHWTAIKSSARVFFIGIFDAVIFFFFFFLVVVVYVCCRLVPLCFRHKLSHSTVLINDSEFALDFQRQQQIWIDSLTPFVRSFVIHWMESSPHWICADNW